MNLTSKLKTIYDKLITYNTSHLSNEVTPGKIVFIKSFNHNNEIVIQQLYKEFPQLIVHEIGNKPKASEIRYIKTKIIPDILTAKIVIIEDYLHFLANLTFNPKTEVIQLWHSIGAIKKFGRQDNNYNNYSDEEIKRFNKVYSKMTKVVVSSKEMAEIFKSSYGFTESQIIYTGLPKTSFYKKSNRKKNIDENKNILYAPTYNRNRNKSDVLTLINTFKQNIPKGYNVFIQLHPRESKYIPNLPRIPMEEVDILITDYSSICWDYMIKVPNGIVLFYCPDYFSYAKTVGIQSWFIKQDKIINSNELYIELEYISDNYSNYLNKNYNSYLKSWNFYNDSNSYRKFIFYLKKMMV